jgi:hypothetical protein
MQTLIDKNNDLATNSSLYASDLYHWSNKLFSELYPSGQPIAPMLQFTKSLYANSFDQINKNDSILYSNPYGNKE